MEDEKDKIEIIDNKEGLTPDNSVAVPNDLVDKYMAIFDKESQLPAVLDLIQQAYKAGLDIGRNESPLFAIIPMSILENKNLSANAKLLYGEIMALSKRSGKCYATNEHLSKVLGLKKTSIPNLLRELSGSGLVIIDIKRSKEGTYRDIMVSFFNNGGCSNLTRGGIANEQGQKRNRQKEIDKKKEGEISPADEMKLFLEDESYFQKLVGFLTNEKGLPEDVVIRELKNFKGYWTELNKSGKKQRWEDEKHFQLSRRLSTWFRNVNKFSPSKESGRKISIAFKI